MLFLVEGSLSIPKKLSKLNEVFFTFSPMCFFGEKRLLEDEILLPGSRPDDAPESPTSLHSSTTAKSEMTLSLNARFRLFPIIIILLLLPAVSRTPDDDDDERTFTWAEDLDLDVAIDTDVDIGISENCNPILCIRGKVRVYDGN